jgi:hypothetical protein
MEKEVLYLWFFGPYGAIKEMVIWQLPDRDAERPHGLKYRLYYGMADGTCMVRYDNEAGKGDHRHFLDEEKMYLFKNIESLVNDFQNDIDLIRRKNDEQE